MAQEFLAITDDTYTFTESDDEKVFYFYRNDEEKLGDVGRIPMDFYQAYIARKMMDENILTPIFGNLRFETSSDEKIMRITVVDYKELPEVEKDSTNNKKPPELKQPGIFKRIFEKIRKQKHKD